MTTSLYTSEDLSLATLRTLLQQGDYSENIPEIDQLMDHPLLKGVLSSNSPFSISVYDRRRQKYAFVDPRSEEITGIPSYELLR